MTREWSKEECFVVPEPKSGTKTVRFPFGNIIYCETPRTSPDGKRFVVQGGDGVYFTADLKHVIYREKDDPSSTDYSTFKAYAAELTDDFLASLN